MSGPQDKELPKWLNETFLENVFKKKFKNNELKVLEVDHKLATAAAENYTSQMLRISITFKANKRASKENLSVIAKLSITGEMGKELQNLQIYDKEADAFTSVLPIIDGLLRKAYPDHKKLWADCYYYQKEPNYILILEDLRVRGFTLASRFEGLDLDHSILAVKSLAKLHAASLVWKQQHPEKFDFYMCNAWNNEDATFLKKTLGTPFKSLSEDVLTWTEFEERDIVSKKLKSIEEIVVEKVRKLWELDNSKLNVLIHGDVWVNNIMFKYDPNGKLAEMNFVDFQLMSINNPAMDLQYFLSSSANHDLRFNRDDEFLHIYYESFKEALKRLGHQLEKPYSFEQLKKDFEEKYFWGMVVFFVIYPIRRIPESEAFHPDEFCASSQNDNYGKAYKRKSLRNALIHAFKHFEKMGVF